MERAGFNKAVISGRRLGMVMLLMCFLAVAKPPKIYQEIDQLTYQSQEEAIQRIEALRQKHLDATQQLWLNTLEAKALYHLNQFADSQSLLIKTESAAAVHDEPTLQEMILRLMGQNFYRMGGFDQAMSHALKAQLIADEHQLLWEQAQLTNMIAAIHLRSGDHQLALDHFNRALAYFESVDAKVDVAKLNNNLGAVYIETGQFSLSETHLNAALALAVELDRPTTYVSALVNQIELFTKHDDFEQALQNYQTCLGYSADKSLSSFEVWCLEAGAEMFQSKGKHEQAITVAERAHLMAGEQNLLQSQINLGKLLVDLYTQTEQFEQALGMASSNLKQVEASKDQVLKLKLKEVSALNNVARTRTQLQFEQEQNRLYEKNQRLTMIGLAILVPMLIMALLLLRSKLRLVKALNAQQQETQDALREMRKAKEINEQLARTDSLTGLFNRRAMTRILHSLCAKGANGKQHIMMIDVDDFKAVNDLYGHATGDEVLVELAKTLQDSLPEAHESARWGGEEFLVLLSDADSNQAVNSAQRLLKAVSEKPVGEPPTKVTISIGLCQRQSDQSMDQWIHQADQALYQSKNNGKNQITISG